MFNLLYLIFTQCNEQRFKHCLQLQQTLMTNTSYNCGQCRFIYSSVIPPIFVERKKQIIFANFFSLGWSFKDKKQVVEFANDLENLKFFCTDLNSKVLGIFGFKKIPIKSLPFKNQKMQYNANSRKMYIHLFDVPNEVSLPTYFPLTSLESIQNERKTLDQQKRTRQQVDAYKPSENISGTKSKSKSAKNSTLKVEISNPSSSLNSNSFNDEELDLFVKWNIKGLPIPKNLFSKKNSLNI